MMSMTLGQLIEFEGFVHETGLRGDEAIAAFKARVVKVKPLWSGDPEATERFVKKLHQDINEMRQSRIDRGQNCELIPGDGWYDWARGREYVPGPHRKMINIHGWLK